MDPKNNHPGMLSKAKGYNGGGWVQAPMPPQPKQVYIPQPITVYKFDKSKLDNFVSKDLFKDSDYVYQTHQYLGPDEEFEQDEDVEVHKVFVVTRKKRTKKQYYWIHKITFFTDDDDYIDDQDEPAIQLTETDMNYLKTVNVDSLKILYGQREKK